MNRMLVVGVCVFVCCSVALAAPVVSFTQLVTNRANLTIPHSNNDPLNGRIATRISGGWHYEVVNYADQEPALTDGNGLGTYTGVMADFPGPGTPAWSGFWDIRISNNPVFLREVRIYSGNLDKDGRVFHHVDLYVTTANPPQPNSTWTLLIAGVVPIAIPVLNPQPPNAWEATMSVVKDSGGADLAAGVTGLRVDAYSVSGTDRGFRDQWDAGTPNDVDGVDAAFESSKMYEIDAFFSTTGAPTPTPTVSPTPVGPDVDMDGVPDDNEAPNNNVQPGQSNRILSDSDGDGRLDGQEDTNANGQQDSGETSTRNRDTDGDRFEDGIEVLMSQNPLVVNPGFQDADGDGLPDSIDPNSSNRDTDGDRYDDGYDALYGHANNSGLKPALGDVNGDSFVTSLDALVVQSLFLAIINESNPVFNGPVHTKAFRYADPNRDGFVTSLDALIIQSYFLQILAILPLR